MKMAVPEQQNSADGDTAELPIGIDETVRLPVSEILYVDSVKTVAHSICCHLTGQGVTARRRSNTPRNSWKIRLSAAVALF